MIALPGWDSLESVGRWVTFWEIMMIIILAALVGAEVFHFKYNHRLNVLIAAREDKAKNDADAAEARRKTEVGALQNQLSEADKKVAELEKRQPYWQLTQAQESSLRFAFQQGNPGQELKIEIIRGDQFGRAIADKINEIATSAHWRIETRRESDFAGSIPFGISVTLNFSMGNPRQTPPGVGALIQAIKDAGLGPEPGPIPDNLIPVDAIGLRIGRKPFP